MPRIVVHKSKRKSALITAVGFLIALAGGLVLGYTDATVVGWCFLIAAAFTLIYGIGTSFDRRPYIVLTERGITELLTIREEIGWDAIRYADDFFFRGQSFVRLLLDPDYKPQLIRPTWFWRFDRLYGQDNGRAVYLRATGLEINSMQLAALIRRMREADPAQRGELLKKYGAK